MKWASLTRLGVNQVADTSTTVGDIRAAYTYQPEHDSFAAWAYLPAATAAAGDIWFNGFGTSGVQVWTPGSFSNFTLLHELGHALGLKHSFEGTVRLPTASDSIEYTVMSYSAVPGNTQSYLTYYPTTPMLLDVVAIQFLYGANYSYNSGDTTYEYSDSVRYNETVWDGGGNDTLRYDGSFNVSLDLNEGHGSTIGRRVYMGTSSLDEQPINNVWIAYGAQIENAVGGSGNDQITGNSLGNALVGGGGRDSITAGAGDDALLGGAGEDRLDGGLGTDFAVYSGIRSAHTVTLAGVRPTLVSGAEGLDTLTGIERLAFADVNVAYDLDGAAGAVAKIIGAVFGKSQIANRSYVGIGLDYLDSGASMQDVMTVALQARLGAGYAIAAEIDLLYRNVTGAPAGAADIQYWAVRVASGEYSSSSLAIMAADTSLNAVNIDLTGLASTGLAFVYA